MEGIEGGRGREELQCAYDMHAHRSWWTVAWSNFNRWSYLLCVDDSSAYNYECNEHTPVAVVMSTRLSLTTGVNGP